MNIHAADPLTQQQTLRGYRPDIDGLRAVAVLSVVAFHYGAGWLPGGFAGVDIFFVISGYLITKHLAEDIARNGSSLGPLLLRFYNKRIRRIFPALLVVLLATLAAGYLILLPGDLASTSNSSAYAAFGLGNLYFYWNTGYFDREAGLQPLLHMWSLGVEEQFYFVWPVLLAVILLLARGKAIATAAIIAGMVGIGLLYSAYEVGENPAAAFYLPLPRAWELGAGALIAFLPSIRSRPFSEAMGIAAIALIAWSLFRLSGSETALGFSMAPAVAGAALLVWPRQPTIIGNWLSTAPMRFIGLLSYSLYLWHWPVLVFFRHYNNGKMPETLESLVLFLLSVALSYLTWRFVETLRYARLSPRRAIVSGLASSAIVASASVAIVAAAGLPGRFPFSLDSVASLEVMWDWKCDSTEKILGRNWCIVGNPLEGSTRRLLLVGDSHAAHTAPLIQTLVEPGTSVILSDRCPVIYGGAVNRVQLRAPNYAHICRDQRRDILELVAQYDIGTVIVVSSWRGITGNAVHEGTLPAGTPAIEIIDYGLREFIETLPSDKVKVVVLGPFPSFDGDPLPCSLGVLRANCPDLLASSYAIYTQELTQIDKVFAQVAKDFGEQVKHIAPAHNLCQNGQCPYQIDGVPLYRDVSHIRRNLAPAIRRKLAELAGLPGIAEGLR